MKSFSISKIVLVIYVISIPGVLSAQTLKGKWTRTFLDIQFPPGDMAFSDTNHGFIVRNNGSYDNVVYYSNDGFQHIDTFDFYNYFGPVGFAGTGRFNAAFCTDSENYFIAPALPGGWISYPVYSSSDGGFDWTSRSQEAFRNPKNGGTISACQYYKMFSQDTGAVLAIVPGSGHVVDTPYNGYYVSFDGDSSYQELGNPIWHEPIGGYAANLQDLFALTDTLTALESIYTWKQFLLHSTDSGKDWQPIFPVDTTNQFTCLTPMVKGYGAGHYFLTGGRVSNTAYGERTKIDDYLESTDDGATWVAHSNVSGGRVSNCEPGAKRALGLGGACLLYDRVCISEPRR
jgi:hypothetical protein